MKIDAGFFDISQLDTFANGNSAVHQLDPRAKVITSLVFIVAVVSFDKYTVSQLLPFLLFPICLVAAANLPPGYFIKKLILVAPFVFFVAIFNPFLDHVPLVQIGSVTFSGGWVSFLSIILRFVLSVSAALLLVATTGFVSVCIAVEQLGAPRVFTVQLLFLYRYIFVLIDEGMRMMRAHDLRSFKTKGMRLHIFKQLIGNLLLRTLDRSQRIHMAMLCRGFDGEIRTLHRYRFTRYDLGFTLCCSVLFICMRLYNVPQALGGFLLEIL